MLLRDSDGVDSCGLSAGAASAQSLVLAKVDARLSKDNRFRKMKASVSQPGVVILEDEVFDEEVKQLAAQRVRKVDGVKKVINALHISTLNMVAGAEPRHPDAP